MFKFDRIKLRKILCKLNFHVSDKDYGFTMSTGKVFSNCVHCRKSIQHKYMRAYGGGN